MRLAAILAVCVGVALAVCVALLAIPAPFYAASGLLVAFAPRAIQRKRTPRWSVRVRTGPLVDGDEKDLYGRQKTYIGVYVECVHKGHEPIWIGGFDVRQTS